MAFLPLLLARSINCVNRYTAIREHSCGHNRMARITKGVKSRNWVTGLLYIAVCARRCDARGRHAFERVYMHVRIFRARSRYLRRAGPRSRSIMYQPQMCISPAGYRTMIDQCDTRGLTGRNVTRVHTGEPLSVRSYFPLCRRSSCYRETHGMYYIAAGQCAI